MRPVVMYLFVAIVASLLQPAFAQAPAPVDLLRRVSPTKTVGGVVLVRDALEVPIDAPLRGANGEWERSASKRFPRVYRLEFQLERTEVLEGSVERTTESRGTIHLALHFEPEDALRFDDQLRGLLESLSAAAFSRPLAGTWETFGTTWIADLSVEPSYACVEDGESRRMTVFARRVEKLADGTERIVSSGTTATRDQELVDPLCEALADGTGSTRPEEIRTLALPRAFEDVRLSLDASDDVSKDVTDEIYPDQLFVLPEGVTFSVSPAPPGVSSYSRRSFDREEGIYDSEVAHGGEVHRARTVPVDLPPITLHAHRWIGRWTLGRSSAVLGPAPSETALATSSLISVLLPIAPPENLDEEGRPREASSRDAGDGAPVGIDLDLDALIDDVTQKLHRESDFRPERVEAALTSRPAGLGPPAWILVVCREDGTARYWLPPASAHSPLTNADLFCAEARRQLGE